MEPVTQSAIVACGILAVFLAIGIPIGVVLAIAGMAGIIIFTGRVDTTAFCLPFLQSVQVTTTYSFLVIPMFMLLGELAAGIGLSKDLFDTSYRWLGNFRGGLAISTVVTCAGMASITGSSVATAAAMTKIALPELREHKYKDELSVGTITVGGTLAIMIPPSITLVVYAIFAEQSIGKLLMAGILPGFLIGTLYTLLIILRCQLQPSLGPRGPKFSLREKLLSLTKVGPFLLLILTILLGILFGIWTPVEASGVGVIVVLVMGLVRRRIKLRALIASIIEAVVSSASVMILIIGAFVFARYLAISGLNVSIINTIFGWDLSPFSLFLTIVLLYIILGMFLDPASMQALTICLLVPVITAQGWSLIWFGVIVVSLIEIGLVTPPVGLNLYAVKAAAPELPLQLIYFSCIPFWLCNIVAIIILYFVPDIALMLPNMMIR